MPSALACDSTQARGTPRAGLRRPVSSNMVSKVAARRLSRRACHRAIMESLPPLDEQSALRMLMSLAADEIDIAFLAVADDTRFDVEHPADHFAGERVRHGSVALDAAVAHRDDSRAITSRQRQVMKRGDHELAVGGEELEAPHRIERVFRIQAGNRLIDHERLGIADIST